MKNQLLKVFLDNQKLKNKLLWRYMKQTGGRHAQVTNLFYNNLQENLRQSSSQFISRILSYDQSFIQNACIPSLSKLFVQNFDSLRKQNYSLKVISDESTKNEQVTVCPYVIFRCNMDIRQSQPNPYSNLIPVFSLNRFIRKGQQIQDQRIIGFTVFYTNNQQYQLISPGEIKNLSKITFCIRFETNQNDLDFYVSDFNFLLLQNLFSSSKQKVI